MEENEEKGFVVKDRRKISLEEDASQPAAEPSQEPMEAEAEEEASRPDSSGGNSGGRRSRGYSTSRGHHRHLHFFSQLFGVGPSW